MKKFLITRILICGITLFAFTFSTSGQDKQAANVNPSNERNQAYSNQLESFLRNYLVDEYGQRASKVWNRDYSSIDAYQRSVEPNRKRWESLVIKPPILSKSGSLLKRSYTIENVQGEWLELPLGSLKAEAFLAFPANPGKQKQVPLIIVQHGIGSTPETPFRGGNYHAYAAELLKAGYAVLVPFNLRTIESRNRIERLCRLANVSLPGIELVRVQNLLDIVLNDPRIDRERVGMWGVSLGGLATMFWMPIEPRIKAGVVSGWFNQRLNKMVIPDSRYSCFLETTEDHAFFSGWLTEFTDSDVASLICPRPLQIQHGKKDNIAYWPQVMEEFVAAKGHYDKLKLGERIEAVIHEGGHEAIVQEGIQFLDKWLKR